MEKLLSLLRKKGNENTESRERNETTCDTPARVRGVRSPPLHKLNVSPLVLALLQDLNEQQWNKVQEIMHSTMTRSQFTSLCSDIATWVSEVATRITLPALALVLDITIIDSSSSSSSSEESLKATSQSPLELPSEKLLTKEDEAESNVSLPKNIFSQGSCHSVDVSTTTKEEEAESSVPLPDDTFIQGSSQSVDVFTTTKEEEEAEKSVPLPENIFSQESSHSVDMSHSTRALPSSFSLQSSGEETSTELTATNILDIIMKRIFQDAEQVKNLDRAEIRSAKERRLDKLRSPETIRQSSPELVQEVRCFIMMDSNALSVLKMAFARVNADLALLKAEGGGRLELARQAFSELVHVFIGKCVRHLLQEFFCLLAQHYEKSEGLISAVASSPSDSLHDVPSLAARSEASDVCGGKGAQIALKPSSEAGSSTLELLITLMVNEVMKFLSVKVGGFNQGTLRCTAGNDVNEGTDTTSCEEAEPESDRILQIGSMVEVKSFRKSGPKWFSPF